MADTTDEGQTIATALAALGPRTIEGDQGRVSMHGVHDAIAALEYNRKRSKMQNRSGIAAVLRTISNHRLTAHDGRAS